MQKFNPKQRLIVHDHDNGIAKRTKKGPYTPAETHLLRFSGDELEHEVAVPVSRLSRPYTPYREHSSPMVLGTVYVPGIQDERPLAPPECKNSTLSND